MGIIAGPALRHSDESEINIWLVVDELPATIDGIIYDSSGHLLARSTIESQAPVKAGARAYVYLLKLIPQKNKLPLDCLLHYDLLLDGKDLATQGLTSGEQSITYANQVRPSVVLKSQHSAVIQGSCRKPHAATENKKQTDMLITADALVEQTLNDVVQRPSRMFLTGDQIYADDVALPMLAKIRQVVDQYLGGDEVVVSTGMSLAQYQLQTRNALLTKEDGFSTAEKDYHLIGFGEYFVMYLLVWGGLEVSKTALPNYQKQAENTITPEQHRVYKKQYKAIKNF